VPLPIQKDWPEASIGWRWIGLAERAAMMEKGSLASASGRSEARNTADESLMTDRNEITVVNQIGVDE